MHVSLQAHIQTTPIVKYVVGIMFELLLLYAFELSTSIVFDSNNPVKVSKGFYFFFARDRKAKVYKKRTSTPFFVPCWF